MTKAASRFKTLHQGKAPCALIAALMIALCVGEVYGLRSPAVQRLRLPAAPVRDSSNHGEEETADELAVATSRVRQRQAQPSRGRPIARERIHLQFRDMTAPAARAVVWTVAHPFVAASPPLHC